VLTLNVPHSRNALSRAVMEDIAGSVASAEKGRRTRVLLVASALETAFCAGADLRERRTLTPEEQGKAVIRLRSIFDALARSRLPSIAVIEGAALGGGAELALACDLRVASRSAVLGFPEARLAIIPGAGGTQRLPRLVGAARAKELILTGRRIPAMEAGKLGLVDYVVENSEAMGKALSIADEMLECGPIALGLAKEAIDRGMDVGIAEGLKLEEKLYSRTLTTKDRAEGVAAFNEKRRPAFTGK